MDTEKPWKTKWTQVGGFIFFCRKWDDLDLDGWKLVQTKDTCPEVCTSEQQTCWVANYDAAGTFKFGYYVSYYDEFCWFYMVHVIAVVSNGWCWFYIGFMLALYLVTVQPFRTPVRQLLERHGQMCAEEPGLPLWWKHSAVYLDTGMKSPSNTRQILHDSWIFMDLYGLQKQALWCFFYLFWTRLAPLVSTYL